MCARVRARVCVCARVCAFLFSLRQPSSPVSAANFTSSIGTAPPPTTLAPSKLPWAATTCAIAEE
eukprot:6192604-Pleurochrysis_carterae.AAC.5